PLAVRPASAGPAVRRSGFGCRLVLGEDSRRDPAAFLDVVAVFLGPFPDLAGVDGLRGAAAAGTAPGRAAGPAGVGDVVRQGRGQLCIVLGVEVDLVLGPVQAETNGAFRLPAVDVVYKQRLNLLRHTAYSKRMVGC